MPLTIEIVTIERVVRVEENVDVLVAPGVEGQLAILPRHAALMTTLDFGELIFRRGNQEESFAIAGGFMEVRNDRVSILADQAESAEEIDLDRARAARERAEQRLRELQAGGRESEADLARVQASLQKSLLRLRVAERRRRAPGAPRPGG
jgi:F-type H+-transporting ATPase subunit epsilon